MITALALAAALAAPTQCPNDANETALATCEQYYGFDPADPYRERNPGAAWDVIAFDFNDLVKEHVLLTVYDQFGRVVTREVDRSTPQFRRGEMDERIGNEADLGDGIQRYLRGRAIFRRAP